MAVTNLDKQFTTFQVAKACGVFHTTVINWVNKGKLKAHCTPGGHRRIQLADLLDFMRRFDMPIPEDLAARRRRVLVVEDDPAVQRMLVRTLQALPDAELTACTGGIEALMAIGKEPPELLVLDVRIPQVNGMEVLRLLRGNPQTLLVKTVAISGGALTPEEEEFLRAHADAFFRKPLSTVDFRRKAFELLDLDPAAGAAPGA